MPIHEFHRLQVVMLTSFVTELKGATDTFSLCVLEALVATNDIKRLMMFAHHFICAVFHIVI